MTREEALARGRPIGAPLGGKAITTKLAPVDACQRCGRSMLSGDGRRKGYMSYIAHLGLHGLADNHFGGDIEVAQRRLRENGMAKADPVPENGMYPRYRPVMEG